MSSKDKSDAAALADTEKASSESAPTMFEQTVEAVRLLAASLGIHVNPNGPQITTHPLPTTRTWPTPSGDPFFTDPRSVWSKAWTDRAVSNQTSTLTEFFYAGEDGRLHKITITINEETV